jgi:signal transduction histidine kinase/ActR/RegA family two-component response regulator/flagellar motility protein MotE (MotC chaperone)
LLPVTNPAKPHAKKTGTWKFTAHCGIFCREVPPVSVTGAERKLAMRGWGTRAEIVLALLVGAIPLVVVAAIVTLQLSRNVPAAQQARADTARDFAAIRAVTAVDEAIQDAERGQRGFLITGRDDYLDPYDRAKERLPKLMRELQAATAGDTEQQQRVLKLQADITTKMNELASTIAAMRASGYTTAKTIVETDLGRVAMQAISTDLAAIGDAENVRLAVRLQSATAADERLTDTFLVGSIVSAMGLLLGAALLVSTVRRATGTERTLKATMDSVREGVAAFDWRGRLRASNAPFAASLGLSAGDMTVGVPLAADRLADAALAERLRELAASARAGRRPALSELATPDGRYIEIFHNPSEAGGYVVTLLDVTERHRTEAALRQAQTLETVGRMTGGVAHDFNNLLTVIIGGLGLLRGMVGRDERAHRRIDTMTTAAERASRLIRQLLAFARRQPLRPQTVNLAPVVQETLPLLRRAVGEFVTVECAVGAGLWNTTIDPAEFQAAVLNLAINSRDAMPDGGKLTIELANATLDEAYASQHADVAPGQYVLFAITDTGSGMDAATMAQALDPFFTTKPPGEGTGLGLPQVYGLVKQLGGHLKIYSEPGQGTTVKVYIPRSLAQETVLSRTASRIAVTGREIVLLVDDDDIVRATVGEMLEDLGYTVIEAAGGEEALAVLQRGDKIDLLFTDVVMPGPLSGRKLADEAKKFDPTLRVLFTSGYTENAIVHHGQLDTGVDLLSKPYTREELGAKMRRVLDGKRDAPPAAAGA